MIFCLRLRFAQWRSCCPHSISQTVVCLWRRQLPWTWPCWSSGKRLGLGLCNWTRSEFLFRQQIINSGLGGSHIRSHSQCGLSKSRPASLRFSYFLWKLKGIVHKQILILKEIDMTKMRLGAISINLLIKKWILYMN